MLLNHLSKIKLLFIEIPEPSYLAPILLSCISHSLSGNVIHPVEKQYIGPKLMLPSELSFLSHASTKGETHSLLQKEHQNILTDHRLVRSFRTVGQ